MLFPPEMNGIMKHKNNKKNPFHSYTINSKRNSPLPEISVNR